METNQKNKSTGKTVLLFSGGMDSLIISYLQKPDILLYIKHGNKYQAQEEASIRKLEQRNQLYGKLIEDDSFQLGEWERSDAIIPMRNLLFLTLATFYGEKLLVGSVLGDRTLDKSLSFFDKTKEMFDFLYQDQHWCEGRKFEITAPYKHLTKTQLVKLYLEKGGNEEALFNSYSCYKGKEKPCLQCKPCVRKMVSLINNDIAIPKSFSFSNVEWLSSESKVYKDILKKKYRGEAEDQEFIDAFRKTRYI